MPNDKRFINFDTLDFTPIAITKRGRTWELRDDIPMRVMARCFTVLNFTPDYQAKLAAAGTDEAAARAAIEAAFDELAATTVPLVGDIFRHTDPDVTDDEIAEWFSDEERMKIIRDFFSLRSQSLSAPSPTPTPASTPTTPKPQAKGKPRR